MVNDCLRLYVVALLLLLLVSGCQINPATGQRQFNVLGEASEIRLGSEAEPEFLRDYGGPIPSAGIRAYVSNIGRELANESERASLPWEFHVVDSSVINAFALPGGKVFVTRGLLSKFTSEAELAGVLGHEIGHVTAQHQGQQISRQLVLSGIMIGIGVAAETQDEDWLKVLGVGSQVGGTLYLLKFGRDQETQADELGVRYMTRLGYNPVALIKVMELFRAEQGAGGQMEFLSTHPAPQSRIDHLSAYIRKHHPDFEDLSKYRFEVETYKKVVLSGIAKMPPAKHNSQQ
ncbi:MAG: M48 family metalloprotease [Phycisphaerales bacterium]|nr:M48 family metalloprotease [Phycisphaerales bacterium]